MKNKITNSFVNPRPKCFFVSDTKLWFGFICIIVLIFVLLFWGLVFLDAKINKSSDKHIQEAEILEQKIVVLEENIRLIKSVEDLSQKLMIKNTLISQNIEKLFSLVPDSVYLDDAFIDKKNVVLKGHVPSKQIFDFFLLPVLKSVFNNVETSFFSAENGWFSFETKCFVEKEDIYEK